MRTSALSIHGEPLWDIVFQVDGEAHARSARLGSDALPGGVPSPGDRIRARFIMDTVTRIEK